MAKRGRPKKVGPKLVKQKKAAKPNGQEALAPAEREMPADGEKALDALRVLADLNDAVKACELKEARTKADHKDAKDALDEAQKALSKKLWELTHAPDLPLFNASAAEADVQKIQEAAETGAATTAGASVLSDETGAVVPPLALPDKQVADDQPF